MREIQLSSRKYPGLVAQVDDADYERVAQHTWWPKKDYATGNFYAYTQIDRHTIYLHRLILRVENDVDHKDGNGLNCQKYNLRPATQGQNQGNEKLSRNNSSGYKGVHWMDRLNPWRAQIKVNRRNQHLGFFATPEEAARAYDQAAREHFGEYARLNFPGLRTNLKILWVLGIPVDRSAVLQADTLSWAKRLDDFRSFSYVPLVLQSFNGSRTVHRCPLPFPLRLSI